MGLGVARIAGANRFATAQLVSAEVGSASGEVLVVEGEHADHPRGWPDAIGAAAYAAFRGDPILLLTRDRLPQETVDAIAALGATRAAVVGGDAAVSDAVESGLRTATGQRRPNRGRHAL